MAVIRKSFQFPSKNAKNDPDEQSTSVLRHVFKGSSRGLEGGTYCAHLNLDHWTLLSERRTWTACCTHSSKLTGTEPIFPGDGSRLKEPVKVAHCSKVLWCAYWFLCIKKGTSLMTEGNLGYYLKMEALRVSGSTWSTNLERFLTETLRVRGESLRMPQVAATVPNPNPCTALHLRWFTSHACVTCVCVQGWCDPAEYGRAVWSPW